MYNSPLKNARLMGEDQKHALSDCLHPHSQMYRKLGQGLTAVTFSTAVTVLCIRFLLYFSGLLRFRSISKVLSCKQESLARPWCAKTYGNDLWTSWLWMNFRFPKVLWVSRRSYLSKLLPSQLSICLCPFHLSRISLHLKVLVTLAAAKFENL